MTEQDDEEENEPVFMDIDIGKLWRGLAAHRMDDACGPYIRKLLKGAPISKGDEWARTALLLQKR